MNDVIERLKCQSKGEQYKICKGAEGIIICLQYTTYNMTACMETNNITWKHKGIKEFTHRYEKKNKNGIYCTTRKTSAIGKYQNESTVKVHRYVAVGIINHFRRNDMSSTSDQRLLTEMKRVD